jgi:ribosomal protein S6
MTSRAQQTPTIEQILTLLAQTPRRLAALMAGLAPAQLHAAPNRDAWSANDVLAHLRACADVWGNCIVAIVAEDTPTLRAVNPRTWIKKTDYLELNFRPSLRSFATHRQHDAVGMVSATLTCAFRSGCRPLLRAIDGAIPWKEVVVSPYELMYVVRPELDDDGVQHEIDRVNQLIQTNGGQVKKVTPWGKRRLSYTIKDLHEGHYVVAEFDLDHGKVVEVERVLKITDTVVRHLLVRQEEGKKR